MLFCLQIALYCLLFFLLFKCAVKNDGRNCLYFYPPAFIDEAARPGAAALPNTATSCGAASAS